MLVEPRKHVAAVAHVHPLKKLNVLHNAFEVMIPDDSAVPSDLTYSSNVAPDYITGLVDDIAPTNGAHGGVGEVGSDPLQPVRTRSCVVVSNREQRSSHETQTAVECLNLTRARHRRDMKRELSRERVRNQLGVDVIVANHDDDFGRSASLEC
jgi:hypothetical protein